MTDTESTRLVWVTNSVADPTYMNVPREPGQTMQDAFDLHMRWRSQLEVGPPKATEFFTEAQLRAFRMVGLYRRSLDTPYTAADIKLLRGAIPPVPIDEARIQQTLVEADARRARGEEV